MILTKKAIAKYENHPSIISIKRFMKNLYYSFSFQHVPNDKVTKLDPTKIVQLTDIPTELTKTVSGFSFDYMYINLNKCIKGGEYIEDFRKKEVRILYKKDDRKEKNNCRLVSIRSNVSKNFKMCLYHQIYFFFLKKYFRDLDAGFVKVSIPKMQFFHYRKDTINP